MKLSTKLFGGTALALLGGYYALSTGSSDDSETVTMEEDGVTVEKGMLSQKRTVDWEVVLRKAVERKTSLLTLTKKYDKQRDREITQSVLGVSASDIRVRVNYHVEYPIGYVMSPGSFSVSGDAEGLTLTVTRPQLIAKPSVKLEKAVVIDSGLLFNEDKALVRLQQSIQRVAENRAAAVLRERDVLPTSERALRTFLQPFLEAAAEGGKVPPIKIVYKRT